jgi:seryl-tRNA synthetase
MHDIRAIRQRPAEFDEAMRRRRIAVRSGDVLAPDERKRAAVASLQELQQRANAVAREIGALRAAGKDASALTEESKEIKRRVAEAKQAEGRGEEGEDELARLLASLPNVPHASVPEGEDETGNVEIRRSGTPPAFDFTPKRHWELGEESGEMDFKQAAAISGSRFVVLKGGLARMERALAQFMVDLHTREHGYTEVSPPLLVRDEAMFGVGQLPKFAEESFVTTDGRRLAPTSEAPLANLVRETILPKETLPLRFCADTLCFRSEAGAAGRDTRGMIRLHQFRKVELVSVTDEESSYDEHERMTACAEKVLERLGLPYRRMLLCAGDMGFAAAKTYDLEVWLPGEGTYREISSCSNCEGFQARRMKARYRVREGETSFVHTLNGSALAVGRCLVAVMENYQRKDGTVRVPEALLPYMGGVEAVG